MAGDWIPMRLDLAEDPAVMAIADATGLTTLTVVGSLHRIWSWANQQLENGHAPGVTLLRLDALVGVTNFGQAMLDAGWLDASNGGVTIPKFEVWNSQGAKRRLLAARRKQSQRSRSERDKSVTREEKRKGKKKRKNPPTPKGGESVTPPQTLFERFWAAYPRRIAKPKAHAAFMKHKPTEDLLAKMLAAIAWQSETDQWRKDNGQYVPHPTTWLNQERWTDERPPPGTPNMPIRRLDRVTQYAIDTAIDAAGLTD